MTKRKEARTETKVGVPGGGTNIIIEEDGPPPEYCPKCSPDSTLHNTTSGSTMAENNSKGGTSDAAAVAASKEKGRTTSVKFLNGSSKSKKKKVQTQPAQDNDDVAAGAAGANETWIECENCETWYHWRCVAPNPLDPIDIVDKWYCPPCLNLPSSSNPSKPLYQITYHPPPRQSTRLKSSRSTKPTIDYSNLHQGIESDPGRWRKLMTRKGGDLKVRKAPEWWIWEDCYGSKRENGDDDEDDDEDDDDGENKKGRKGKDKLEGTAIQDWVWGGGRPVWKKKAGKEKEKDGVNDGAINDVGSGVTTASKPPEGGWPSGELASLEDRLNAFLEKEPLINSERNGDVPDEDDNNQCPNDNTLDSSEQESTGDEIGSKPHRPRAGQNLRNLKNKHSSIDEEEKEEEDDDYVPPEMDEGLSHPILIKNGKDGLGMKMPWDLTVSEVADLVGKDTPVEVIDVASQTGLSNWTVGKWAQYYNNSAEKSNLSKSASTQSRSPRDKIRNVISLEVSQTKLGKMVREPTAIGDLDWVLNFWPDDLRAAGTFPKVQKYCLMSVSHCWTDWHIDFAGSSVFYHILRGSKIFYFIPPTPENLKKYQKWSSDAELQETTWLGDEVDRVYKLELPKGSTTIIPTGWIHAVYTPEDSLVIGGNWLNSLNIPTQLKVYDIEIATKVPKKFRFPQFERLCWYVALGFTKQLGDVIQQSSTPAPCESSQPISDLPRDLPPRVLRGLKSLSVFLAEQARRAGKNASDVGADKRKVARESIPQEILNEKEPVEFVKEFRSLVFQALGEVDDGPEEEERSTPATTTTQRGASSSGVSAASRKRITSASASASPAPVNGKAPATITLTNHKKRKAEEIQERPKAPKFKNFTSVSPSKQTGDNIIQRHSSPPRTVVTRQPRTDPGHPGLGERDAAVQETRNEQVVVRRNVDNETGKVMVETRRVTTVIEKVTWTPGSHADGVGTKVEPVDDDDDVVMESTSSSSKKTNHGRDIPMELDDVKPNIATDAG